MKDKFKKWNGLFSLLVYFVRWDGERKKK